MENSEILKSNQKYSVIELNHDYDLQWSELVSSIPDSVVFHHPLWIRALESEYNQNSIVFGAFNSEGKLAGVFPVFASKGFPFGVGGLVTSKRLSSLPRTPLGGPVSLDVGCKEPLILAAVNKLKEIDDSKIQIKTTESGLNEYCDLLKKVPWRETFLLEVPDSTEKIRFGNKTRNHRIQSAVSKAQKSGITIRTAESEEDLKEWYKLYLDTMRYIALPARAYRLFKFMYENLKPKGLMRLLLAEIETDGRTRLLTGAIFLTFNKTFFYSFSGRKMNEPSLHQNDFLLYTAIHQACVEGYKYFDFGEVTSDNEGLARFKNKWGCSQEQIYHYYYPLPTDFVKENVDSGAGSGRLRKFIWNKLPLPVTEFIGDKIYRYL